MSGLERLFPRFAAALDRLKPLVPIGYDLNLVLVNRALKLREDPHHERDDPTGPRRR